MSSLNQRGAIQFIILLILLAGIAVGVYLITSGPLKIFPRASVSSPVTPQTSFILNDPEATKIKQVGSEFKVFIWARSDIEPANLFTAKLQYPSHLLEVVSMDKAGSFITSWVEEYFDNDTGIISLIGGVPAPGLSTVPNNTQFMVSITFRAKNAGTAVVIFSDDSAIYSNANNIDILTVKEPLTLSLGGSTVPPSPTSAPTPTPTSTPSFCNACAADISKNGRVSVVDYSSAVTCVSRGISGKDDAGRACSLSDIDQNGVVDQKDVDCITSQFGNICVLAPSPTPILTPTPQLGNGDGNRDGIVSLADLSILLSNFNKTSGFPEPIDLNGDGRVNSIDYGLMVQILIKAGVIKGGGVG